MSYTPAGIGPPSSWTLQCERIARSQTKGIFFPGADHDDVLQEARFGVWRSMRDWRPDGGSSWPSFAHMCANRQVLTGLRLAQAGGKMALNDAIRFSYEINDDGEDTLEHFLTDGVDVVDIVSGRETIRRLVELLPTLTEIERAALVRCAIDGDSYESVGERKRVDNAMQRARRKLTDLADAA